VPRPNANAFELGTVWGAAFDASGDNIVWGTYLSEDNIVWGTLAGDDNIVWGTDCGGANCEAVIWGSSIPGLDDNIVWGTAEFAENIVWGTAGDMDNIVWGTSTEDDGTSWGNSGDDDPPLFDDPNAPPATFENADFDALFPPELADEPAATGTNSTTTGGTLNSITSALGGLTGGL
jgi:hypothetical protein